MPKPKCRTAGCSGDPTVPGAGNGDCPRCYQWNRRHPKGPPPSPTAAAPRERPSRVAIRVSQANKRAALKLARAAGKKLAPWIEQLVTAATGVL